MGLRHEHDESQSITDYGYEKENTQELSEKKRIRKMIEDHLEKKKLKEDFMDFEEINDDFDWSELDR